MSNFQTWINSDSFPPAASTTFLLEDGGAGFYVAVGGFDTATGVGFVTALGTLLVFFSSIAMTLLFPTLCMCNNSNYAIPYKSNMTK
jgi:hypothetical protein